MQILIDRQAFGPVAGALQLCYAILIGALQCQQGVTRVLWV
jgi:hypothetical protein